MSKADIKGSIYQKDIAILNVYVTNNKPIEYKKKWAELEGEINKSTIIIRDLTVPPPRVTK